MTAKDINNAKAALLIEIKDLCEEIQKAQTFSGLVSLESRINALHENFIILKYLDQQSVLVEPTLEKQKEKKDQPDETVKPNLDRFPKLALSLNDKIAFQNQLFNKDAPLFESVIVQLNTSNSLSEAKNILAPYAVQFEWNLKEEFVQRFEELIEKRFA